MEAPKKVNSPRTATPNGDYEISLDIEPDRVVLEEIPNENQNSQLNKQAGIIYLAEGENKFLKEYNMNVTFKRMIDDSRCPKDLDCVWAGNATAEIELMGTYTRPITLQISTTENASKGYYKSQKFNGYEISLTNITPEPTTERNTNALKGQYKIALKFTKESGKQ